MSLNVIHAKCEKAAADDPSLPRNAYLVTYVEKEKITYDVVMADSRVDIFDEYWDKYKEGLQGIDYAKGNVKPLLWNNNNKKKEEKKVKRKRK
jgi:hypothetical protein|tara:strand:+ start:1641 stop:1919 length:279 start_codon:yes stop_codon:yes gene_type:complete